MERDPGVEEAVRAVGGVGALARGLGISQPSVSSWRRIPAARVLDVEALTGISRAVLRPDLYAEPGSGPAGDTDEVEVARSHQYALLASLLLRAPDADALARLSRLGGDAETPLGQAHGALARAAASASAETVRREYFDLFVGVGRGEIVPYASYYLTGFLNERPLARLREDMKRLGIERVQGHPDPEDHLGTLCEIMSGFAAGCFEASPGEQGAFFARHLAPWAGRCLADMEGAESARFYRAVAAVGRVFIDIETEGFAMEARQSA
jgi:TorA maturation chaperone TorD